MSLRSDRLLMQQLTSQAAGTSNGPWIDLSGYRSAAFYLVVTALTGTVAVAFHMSADQSVDIGAIPTAELGTALTLSAPGAVRQPFIWTTPGPPVPEWPWVRAVSTVTTGPATANVYFIGSV
jgi:hypothetical protein